VIEDLFGNPWRAAVTVLDILMVYYVIYRVLLTIKGTRAAQMVVGIVLIGASSLVAERLEMSIVSWLLDNFFNYLIIIIIVLFQQDIRRALMRIGQNVVPFGKTHQLAHALDEVLAAAEHLARARMGGIVVFEREAEVQPFVDAGKVVDARVSRELVVALFVPSRDNELHDGAIIVNKQLRIERAGVLLPLSRAATLSQEYGTRHRAALGITEETDAVVLVVSEERGEISLCFKGNIARDLEVAKLRERLQALFEQDTTSKVATEAEAAASIGKAMAALAATDVSSEPAPPPPRTPRSTSIVPVTQSVPSERGELGADRMVEPSS
jgi:diadenylate cyclase